MSVRCPACGGGSSGERSLSVYTYGLKTYRKCHRASCGYIESTPMGYMDPREIAAPGASPEVLRPYTGDRFPLTGRPVAENRIIERFGFSPPGMGTVAYTVPVDAEPFLLPILAPNGSERGVMEAVYGRNKRRRIWKAKHEPMISWTREGDHYDGVYLVEDQISALKLHHVASIRAVALLGTSLNAESVAEIQRTARHVTIALDSDATGKAFLLARKWGAAFKSCAVQILTKDIKDQSFQEIRELVRAHQDTPSAEF